jgi:hypothetical protein
MFNFEKSIENRRSSHENSLKLFEKIGVFAKAEWKLYHPR